MKNEQLLQSALDSNKAIQFVYRTDGTKQPTLRHVLPLYWSDTSLNNTVVVCLELGAHGYVRQFMPHRMSFIQMDESFDVNLLPAVIQGASDFKNILIFPGPEQLAASRSAGPCWVNEASVARYVRRGWVVVARFGETPPAKAPTYKGLLSFLRK